MRKAAWPGGHALERPHRGAGAVVATKAQRRFSDGYSCCRNVAISPHFSSDNDTREINILYKFAKT